MRHWNAACVYQGSVSLSVQSALARRLCTSRWLPEPTLCNPYTLANISAELWVAAGMSVSKGRCWVCLWAIKVFLCWNWLVERNWRSCGMQQSHCLWDLSALAVLYWSSVIWQHHGGAPGDLWGQVNQGSGQKQSTPAGGGWGEHTEILGVMVLLQCSDISLILCLVLPLVPAPPSCFHWHHHLEWWCCQSLALLSCWLWTCLTIWRLSSEGT